MNWNFSAWAIRNPVPPILLFVVLVRARLDQLPEPADHAVPEHRRADDRRARSPSSGSAPSELETQVTKRVEDAISGITGVKHITSTITDGQSVTAIEFRLEINTDRALNDVKDADRQDPRRPAAHDRRADRPAHRRRGPVDHHLCGAASKGMTPEELSWFVDDTVVARVAEPQGRRSRRAHRRRDARDPRVARSRPADGARHHRGRGQPAAARHQRRPLRRQERDRRARSRRSARCRARPPSQELGRARRSSLSGGRQVRLSELGTVTDACEEPRSASPASTASRSWPSRSTGRRARRDTVVAERRRPTRSPRSAGVQSGRRARRDRRRRHLHLRQLRKRDAPAGRRRAARGRSWCSCSCATGARR